MNIGTNEVILLIKAILGFTFIQVIFRLNKSFLFIAIVLNLILVSVFGAKLISLFGFVTNNGNVFYAAVFFATQLVVEHYGKKAAYRSVLLGASAIVFFMLMAQLTILKVGQPETMQVDHAIQILFNTAPRVAAASLIAFCISQVVNVSLFSYLRQRTKGRLLYLRINVSNIVGQLADSLLFFTIAFLGLVSTADFIQLMVVGYLIKVGLGLLSTPFFYLQKSKLAQT
jgi:queuosine precursor transporter